VLSFLALRWAANKSQQTFMLVLLGGLLVRLVVLGAAVFWVWRFTTLEAKAFTAALLGSYFIFQIIETMVLQKFLKRMKLARRV